MKILVSNDDGYTAQGLLCLVEYLKKINSQITVVAPDRDRSGASNSLTLKNPLRVKQAAKNLFYVEGTPTDCVHLGITGLMDELPDMVISGINHGANLGDDVLYSGTVAAATEGRFLGLPAIAVSLASKHNEPQHFQTAAQIVLDLLALLEEHPLPSETILNVNVPNLPYEKIKGWAVTRLGHRHKAEPAIKTMTPYGEQVYWVGPVGDGRDAGSGTDFNAITKNHVSITPIKVDLTSYKSIDILKTWLDKKIIDRHHDY